MELLQSCTKPSKSILSLWSISRGCIRTSQERWKRLNSNASNVEQVLGWWRYLPSICEFARIADYTQKAPVVLSCRMPPIYPRGVQGRWRWYNTVALCRGHFSPKFSQHPHLFSFVVRAGYECTLQVRSPISLFLFSLVTLQWLLNCCWAWMSTYIQQ